MRYFVAIIALMTSACARYTEPEGSASYRIAGELAIAEGDIVIGSAEEMENPLRRAVVLARGTGSRWKSGTVYYTIDPGISSELKQKILGAIAHYKEKTSAVKFVARGSQADYLTFTPAPASDLCASPIGKYSGQQFIYLGELCSMGNAIHEIGHTLGLYHEQSREDRDKYIDVHFENIDSESAENFDRVYFQAQDLSTYNFGSIMHYGPFAFSKNGNPTITKKDGTTESFGQRAGLNAGDIASIGKLYSSAFIEAPSELQVVSVGSSSLTLEFVDNSSNENGFKLQYWTGTNSNSYRTISLSSTKYNHTKLSSNTLYNYRVYAYHSNGTSSYSNTVSIRTQ